MRAPALLALLAACATLPPAPAPLRAEGTLTQGPGGGAFTAELRLSRPVRELSFARTGDGDRLRTWRLLAPAGARLTAADGGVEGVAAPAAFDRLTLELPVHVHEPEKDYEPFIPLSGGGVLVFTGQLEVDGDERPAMPWTFVPAPGEGVVVPGAAARGPLRWAGVEGGTYAAFGPAAPQEGARFLAVVDRGLPPWLLAETRALLPRLFDHYAAALGQELPARPTVLLAYGDDPHPGTISMGGGTLEGALQLVVRLGERRRAVRDARVEETLRGILAHEAAHLWNGHLARNTGPDWLHEGGADLLAWGALRKLGLLEPAAFEERLAGAASRCLLLRGEGPLERDRVKARYACGAVVELAASAGSPGPEAVWAALLAHRRAAGTYGAEDFQAACLAAGARPEAVEAAARFARPREGPVRPALEALLGQAGYRVEAAEAPPDFAQEAARAGSPGAAWLRLVPAGR